jgi:hypothetical protein
LRQLKSQHPSFGFGLKVSIKDVQREERGRVFQQEQYGSSQEAQGLLSKDVQGFGEEE